MPSTILLLNETFCAIWYHLYNFKKRRVGVFHSIDLHKWYQIRQSITNTRSVLWYILVLSSRLKKLLATHDYDQLQTKLFSLKQHPSSEEKLITDGNNASFILTELDKLPRMVYNVIF